MTKKQKGFSKESIDNVTIKLNQACEIALSSKAFDYDIFPQLVMFIYDRLSNEEASLNGTMFNPFIPAKRAELHFIDGGKKDDK